MILTKIDLEEFNSCYTIAYFNLATKKAYHLIHNELDEIATEEYLPFVHEEVENLILDNIMYIQNDIQRLESNKNPSYADKAELERYKTQLQYLLNYEHK